MNVDKLSKYVDQGLSQRKIAEIENVSQTKVRYHLTKHKLSTNSYKNDISESGVKICQKCKEIKQLTEFYFSTERGTTHWCQKCSKKSVLDRQVEFKRKCLEYKGDTGCIKCGYSKFYGSLDFHHRNSRTKEFSISKFKLYKFIDSVKEELDKCDVLCSNCHREEHHRLTRNGTVA